MEVGRETPSGYPELKVSNVGQRQKERANTKYWDTHGKFQIQCKEGTIWEHTYGQKNYCIFAREKTYNQLTHYSTPFFLQSKEKNSAEQ